MTLRDYRDSKRVAALKWFQEVVFVRILLHCDGLGRGPADPELLPAALFPRPRPEGPITPEHIIEALVALTTHELIKVYETCLTPGWSRWVEPMDITTEIPPKHKRWVQILQPSTTRNYTSRWPDPPADGTYKGVETSPHAGEPPTLERFLQYAEQIGFPRHLAERVWNDMEAGGWMAKAGVPVRDWQAWCRRKKSDAQIYGSSYKPNTAPLVQDQISQQLDRAVKDSGRDV